jgi:hypothetical protein
MVDHHVEIAHGAKAAAKFAAGAGEGFSLFNGEDGTEEINGGFEAPGGDAGLVDRVFVELKECSGREFAEGFDEFVHVVAERRAGSGFVLNVGDGHSSIITEEVAGCQLLVAGEEEQGVAIFRGDPLWRSV